MYAVVLCPSCKRYRIIDLHQQTSACPYCGAEQAHKELQLFCRCRTQEHARENLGKLTGFTGDGMTRKHADPRTDPLSSLVYEYEHTSALEDKMTLLAKGLTKIYGTFTLAEVEQVDPHNAERMLRAMLVECYVSEVSYGRYRG